VRVRGGDLLTIERVLSGEQSWHVECGDALEVLRMMPDGCVQTCVTSPPYFRLRDYGIEGQIGLEQSPEQYVDRLVEIFREVRRVLRGDGTLWLNLGDSFFNSGSNNGGYSDESTRAEFTKGQSSNDTGESAGFSRNLKQKDLCGIPWRTAFALQADGWYLRSDIIWSKTNPMPESVRDRPTRSHEFIFLMSKSARYYYDADVIREGPAESSIKRTNQRTVAESSGKHRVNFQDKQRGHSRRHAGFNARWEAMRKEEQGANGHNKRDVWTVATHPYPGAHFATFPPALIEPCILAGAPEGGIVLDPFGGSGTTGLVAMRHGRRFVAIELNPAYATLARNRITSQSLT